MCLCRAERGCSRRPCGSLSNRCRIVVSFVCGVGRSLSDRCRIVVGSLSVSFAVLADRHRSSLFVDCRYSAFFATAPIVTLRRSSRRIDCSVRTDRYTRADRYVAPIAEEEKVVTSLAVCAFIPVSSIERIGSIDRSDRSVLLVVLSC